MRKGTSKASSAKAATRAGADVGVGFGGWVLWASADIGSDALDGLEAHAIELKFATDSGTCRPCRFLGGHSLTSAAAGIPASDNSASPPASGA